MLYTGIIMANSDKQRDRTITRYIHRLFWQANLKDPLGLIVCYLTRIPAVAAYNVFIPLVGAWGIQAILNKRFDQVTMYAVWVLVLAVAYSVLWSIGQIFISKNAVTGSKYIQNQVFSNFLSKDYEFYSNAYFGSLGAQASRIREAYNLYGELVSLSIPKQLTIVLSSIVVIAWQSLLLAAITLVAMLAVLSFTIWSSSWRIKFRRRVGEANSEVAGVIGDALTHGTTVKSFAHEAYEEHNLQQPLKKWGAEQYKAWRSSLPADTGRMMLAAIATAVLLIVSARLYQQGTITITIVILIQLYVIKLVASTLDIAEMVKRYEEVMGSAYQPVKTMLISNNVLDPAQPKKLTRDPEYAVRFQTVDFSYGESAKNMWAVKNFTLDIRHGEKVGLVGYSGSGKTTLTKLLLRFMDTDRGSIKLGGIDIRDIRQHDLRTQIAYVPQEPLLFHRTVLHNIGYGKPSADRKTVLKAAQAAYVNEFVDKLDKGYETFVGERGIKLSGGQRQRVAIARALLKDAPILVLDEATSALDSRSEQLIQKALWKLMKDRTALVIAHRLSTIQRMDRIAVMNKGKIVQLGTHDELLQDKKGIYAELWAHQSGGYVGVQTTSSEEYS